MTIEGLRARVEAIRVDNERIVPALLAALDVVEAARMFAPPLAFDGDAKSLAERLHAFDAALSSEPGEGRE